MKVKNKEAVEILQQEYLLSLHLSKYPSDRDRDQKHDISTLHSISHKNRAANLLDSIEELKND